MTQLKVRNLPFRFDDTVPFQWNPSNPEFGLIANAIGMLIVSMEKMIVSVVREVMPRIEDPAVVAESQAFLKQEALHSRAHQLHLRALVARHPGLQETIDAIDASFATLRRENSIEFQVAYIAALEATFPPLFKMMLDHRDTLMSQGDARVASLFAWHFVEEIEHRASALLLYDAVVRDPYYRLRVIGPAFAHAFGLFVLIVDGFEKHVPLEARLVDTAQMRPQRSWVREFRSRLPFLRPADEAYPTAFYDVPVRELMAVLGRLVLAQLPGHEPAHEPVPEWAATWHDAFEAGVDMTTFEGIVPGSIDA